MGHTNREIARDLFLSPRTIEMHVGSILLKLDCRLAGRRGPPRQRARPAGRVAWDKRQSWWRLIRLPGVAEHPRPCRRRPSGRDPDEHHPLAKVTAGPSCPRFPTAAKWRQPLLGSLTRMRSPGRL